MKSENFLNSHERQNAQFKGFTSAVLPLSGSFSVIRRDTVIREIQEVRIKVKIGCPLSLHNPTVVI